MVLTILKHISQWEGLSHILWKKQCLKPPTRYSIRTAPLHYQAGQKTRHEKGAQSVTLSIPIETSSPANMEHASMMIEVSLSNIKYHQHVKKYTLYKPI